MSYYGTLSNVYNGLNDLYSWKSIRNAGLTSFLSDVLFFLNIFLLVANINIT